MNTALAPTDNLKTYFAQVGNIPRLTQAEEIELADRILQDNDKAAAQKMILANLRFVVYIARGYKHYGLPMEDLIQEGNVGLMKAVQKFDSSKKVRLVYYAVHYIKHEIHEYVIKNWQIVKIATTKQQRKLFFKLRGLRKAVDHSSEDERALIAETLNVKVEDVREMEHRLYTTPLGYDQTFNYQSRNPLKLNELIGGGDTNDPARLIEEEEYAAFIKENVMQRINTLPERERDILLSRNFAEKPTTLKDLSKRYNISAERVRQLEERTINNLKDMVTRL